MGNIKTCNHCKKDLEIEKFRYQTKTLKDGSKVKYPRSNCRKCEKIKYYESDGYYRVYLLPFENYVGMTDNIKRRVRQHRESGRNTKDYSILYKTYNPIEAHLFETQKHLDGYAGFNNKNYG